MSGLTASLADTTSNTGDAAGDTYAGIEGLVGTQFADTLIGNNNNNFLVGTGGGDVLNGGLGFDTASYTIFTAGSALLSTSQIRQTTLVKQRVTPTFRSRISLARIPTTNFMATTTTIFF